MLYQPVSIVALAQRRPSFVTPKVGRRGQLCCVLKADIAQTALDVVVGHFETFQHASKKVA